MNEIVIILAVQLRTLHLIYFFCRLALAWLARIIRVKRFIEFCGAIRHIVLFHRVKKKQFGSKYSLLVTVIQIDYNLSCTKIESIFFRIFSLPFE